MQVERKSAEDRASELALEVAQGKKRAEEAAHEAACALDTAREKALSELQKLQVMTFIQSLMWELSRGPLSTVGMARTSSAPATFAHAVWGLVMSTKGFKYP